MILNPYLFIFLIWLIYSLNTLYLNYKMRRFWFQKNVEEFLLIPFYIFYGILLLKIAFYILDIQAGLMNLAFSGFIAPILNIAGGLFCLGAISLFIYVAHFGTFPSCLFIQQGKNLRGIYNYVRHPSYIIFFLITFGTAFYLNNVILFLLACINHVSLYFYYIIEEKRLVKQFPYHREYLKRTRRFFPTFSSKHP